MFDDTIITVFTNKTEDLEVDWQRKLEVTKQQALTAQGNVKTNPRVMVELLEKVLVLQAFNSQGSYSTETAIRYFQGKIDKERSQFEDKLAPNIAGYLFGQVLASIAYLTVTLGLILVLLYPANQYCKGRQSPFCQGVSNIQTYFTGTK